MAKQSGGKPQIDEDFMKEIISQGLPVKKQETSTVTVKTEIEIPDKTDDKTGTVETADNRKSRQSQRKKRRRKNLPAGKRTLRAITGQPISCGWT